MARPPRQVIGAGTIEEVAEFLVGRHPATVEMFRHLTWSHLPTHLRPYSSEVSAVAFFMVDRLPDSPELTVGLRKLLEAKDCFVRCAVELHRAIEDAPVEFVDQPIDRALHAAVERYVGAPVRVTTTPDGVRVESVDYHDHHTDECDCADRDDPTDQG